MKEIRCRWCDGYMALFAESQNHNSKMFVCTTDDCQTDVAITDAGMNWRHVETNKGVIMNITEPVDK